MEEQRPVAFVLAGGFLLSYRTTITQVATQVLLGSMAACAV